MGVFVSTTNSVVDFESYIFQTTIKTIESISNKIVLVVYSIALIISIAQTFWKNKRIDHILAYMNEAYSDRTLESNKIYLQHQIMTCYRFDQRFSHIPIPNRSIILIIATHIHILMLILIKTVFIRQIESINDCLLFHYPYQILQCENNRDPCQFNITESVPKCTYYYFELTNLITMVTSIISWHFALRYFVIKLVRFIRWIFFRDNDQPRRLCCCCKPTPRVLRCSMRFHYISLWLYLFVTILLSFIWNTPVSRIPNEVLGPIWAPILITIDRLYTLTMALIPELIQNWLDITENGENLRVVESKGLFLGDVEPLIYLIDKKTEYSTSIKNQTSQTNTDVIVELTNH